MCTVVELGIGRGIAERSPANDLGGCWNWADGLGITSTGSTVLSANFAQLIVMYTAHLSSAVLIVSTDSSDRSCSRMLSLV